jgi:hypothetical protein
MPMTSFTLRSSKIKNRTSNVSRDKEQATTFCCQSKIDNHRRTKARKSTMPVTIIHTSKIPNRTSNASHDLEQSTTIRRIVILTIVREQETANPRQIPVTFSFTLGIAHRTSLPTQKNRRPFDGIGISIIIREQEPANPLCLVTIIHTSKKANRTTNVSPDTELATALHYRKKNREQEPANMSYASI